MARPYVTGSIPLTQAIDDRSLMLLGTAPRPFKDPAFGWEVKLDGFRDAGFLRGAPSAPGYAQQAATSVPRSRT